MLLRQKKLRAGPRWLRAKLLKNVRDEYPELAKHFKCCPSYMKKWRDRHKIGIRRRTNSKKKPPEDFRRPLQNMHAKFKSRVVNEGKGTEMYAQSNEGKWLIKDRFSVDQALFPCYLVLIVRVLTIHVCCRGATESVQWWEDDI